MTLAERVNELIKELPEERVAEIIDFIEFVKEKEKKEQMRIMENILIENAEAMRELAK